jgi:hypothetical protein
MVSTHPLVEALPTSNRRVLEIHHGRCLQQIQHTSHVSTRKKKNSVNAIGLSYSFPLLPLAEAASNMCSLGAMSKAKARTATLQSVE